MIGKPRGLGIKFDCTKVMKMKKLIFEVEIICCFFQELSSRSECAIITTSLGHVNVDYQGMAFLPGVAPSVQSNTS